MLKGKKTFLAAGVMVVFAVSSFLLGEVDLNTAIQRGIEAAAIIGLRLGIRG